MNHKSVVWPPTPIMIRAPMTNPRVVPAMARAAVAPVPRALERSTDRAPSTTQKPCSTSVTSTTATAAARPAAPRRLFRNHTERKERWEVSRGQTRRGSGVADGPRRRSPTAWAPEASSVESATISAVRPMVRARKLGSSRGRSPPPSGVPSGSASGSGPAPRARTLSSAAIRPSRRSVEARTVSTSVGSSTGCPLASQTSAEQCRRVAATPATTSRTGPGSGVAAGSPARAALSATHSTRPTSLDRATAVPVAANGG